MVQHAAVERHDAVEQCAAVAQHDAVVQHDAVAQGAAVVHHAGVVLHAAAALHAAKAHPAAEAPGQMVVVGRHVLQHCVVECCEVPGPRALVVHCAAAGLGAAVVLSMCMDNPLDH